MQANIVWLVLLSMSMLTAGCAGVEMKRGETSHAYREVPPTPGAFSGAAGEFVIFRADEAKDPSDSASTGQAKKADHKDPGQK